jgi:hypothetical protein
MDPKEVHTTHQPSINSMAIGLYPCGDGHAWGGKEEKKVRGESGACLLCYIVNFHAVRRVGITLLF